jgi:hypothetical protein
MSFANLEHWENFKKELLSCFFSLREASAKKQLNKQKGSLYVYVKPYNNDVG